MNNQIELSRGTTDVPVARYPRILSIAGSDSGGGAGIQADLKTCSALGCYGMTAITAVTAQNTLGVRAIHAVPPKMLRQQIEAVIEDIGVDAIKIGMLHDPEVVHVVADILRACSFEHVVLDPVMVASSGDALIATETIAVLVSELFPLVSVVTPNLDEACLLLGRPIDEVSQLSLAAAELVAMGARAVLLKGGHLAERQLCSQVTDVLCYPQLTKQSPESIQTTLPLAKSQELMHREFSGERIQSVNTHGTGCTLSTALACYLALGLSLEEAVFEAKAYVALAIKAGQSVKTGQGHGPLNHGFCPKSMRVLSD